MKINQFLNIVMAFIATIFATGCSTYQGGSARYETKISSSTQEVDPVKYPSLASAVASAHAQGLHAAVYKPCKNTPKGMVCDSDYGWMTESEIRKFFADIPDDKPSPYCGQIYMKGEKTIVHNIRTPIQVIEEPAPVQTVVVRHQPQVRYVYERECIPRPHCGNGGNVFGQFLGGAIRTGFNLGIPAFQAANAALGYGPYSGHGGQVQFDGGYGHSGASSRTRVINNIFNETNIRVHKR